MTLKSKFLTALLSLLGIALGLASFFAIRIFTEDKKLFVMDLNLSVLRAIVAESKTELRGRVETLPRLVARVAPGLNEPQAAELFKDLTPGFEDEVLGITYYKKGPLAWAPVREYKNRELLLKRRLPDDLLTQLNTKHRQAPDAGKLPLEIQNRSLHVSAPSVVDLGVLSLTFTGLKITGADGMMVVVDLLQDELRKKLQQSELAEVFLVTGTGALLSHSSLKETVQGAGVPFGHPVVSFVKQRPRNIARESLVMEMDGEAYFVNLAETGVEGIYAVSQMKRSDAFAALRFLLERTALVLLIVFSGSVIVSILVASRLSADVRKLKVASEMIANGYQDVTLDLHSKDELGQIAQHVRWMAGHIRELKKAVGTDARVQQKAGSALTTPQIVHPAMDLTSSFASGQRHHGNFWDARLGAGQATVLIGDANGDAAVMPLAAAAARAGFGAMATGDAPPPPETLLATLNRTLFDIGQGKLSACICIAQVNLNSGDIRVASAGAPGVLLWRAGLMSALQGTDKEESSIAGLPVAPSGPPAEPVAVLAPAGEPLGLRREARFVAVTGKMSVGDALLFYTPGVTSLSSKEGRPYGDAALREALPGDTPGNAAGIRDRLEEELSRHRGNTEAQDDRTFLVAVWKESVPETALPARGTAPAARAEAKAATAATSKKPPAISTKPVVPTPPKAKPVPAQPPVQAPAATASPSRKITPPKATQEKPPATGSIAAAVRAKQAEKEKEKPAEKTSQPPGTESPPAEAKADEAADKKPKLDEEEAARDAFLAGQDIDDDKAA